MYQWQQWERAKLKVKWDVNLTVFRWGRKLSNNQGVIEGGSSFQATVHVPYP